MLEELVGDEVLEGGQSAALAADVLFQEAHLHEPGVGGGHDEPFSCVAHVSFCGLHATYSRGRRASLMEAAHPQCVVTRISGIRR